MDKFDIRKHIHTSVECAGATWNNVTSQWDVSLKDLQTEIQYTRSAMIFVSAVGGISYPRNVHFPGMEKFRGHMFHTARWDHSVSYKNKRVAVIGNGCSAAQVVPALAKEAASVRQYARSGQWFHARPNRNYTRLEKYLCRYMPLYQRAIRLRIFIDGDNESKTYFPTPEGLKQRTRKEAEAKAYIRSKTPEDYAKHIIPDFPLGCKRRIYDPNYLDSLNLPQVDLIPEGIKEFTETGIISSSGIEHDYDIVVLATGFAVTDFLTPMHITGANGRTLHNQWKENRGAQAYLGTHVHNFPNLAILFGPNTFLANNSALFVCETQGVFAMKSLFEPIVQGRASVIEVKQAAEDRTTNAIHHQLNNSVFAGDCSNWYIGKFGRNAASWPGLARAFWWATYSPTWSDFNISGGSSWWPVQAAWLKWRNMSTIWKLAIGTGAMGVLARLDGGVFKGALPAGSVFRSF